MSDDSNAPADLSNIGIDLSQIFRPAWTVESSDSTARLAAKYDDGDRGERPERRGGAHRQEGRGPQRDRGPRTGRDRDTRGTRPQPGGQGATGNQRSSREREGSRGPRDHRREERAEPAAKPILEGWGLTLIPEHSALEAIAKQIRSRAKAYPLFELARLVVNLSDRYSVALKAESEESPKLFRVKADGSLWTSRKGAVSHILSKHLEKFYHRSAITTEAPKGNYSVVAQCGMSGVLLGPPNHHEYQSRLLALHASRFKNLPFEVYKTRIKMMRDEELMEKWKAEQSTRTVFIPIDQTATSAATEEISTPIASAESAGTIETPEIAVETVSETPESLAVSEPVATENMVVEADPSNAATEPVLATAEAASTADGPQLTLEEVTEHFQKNHAENEVEEAGSEITLPGRIALHESDPLLHELLIKTLQELDRFPLPLAQVIGKELTGSGLQIFKAQKKIIHVSVARPRYLDRATTPTSEGFRKILDYLEAHPNQQRDKQWAGLLAQVTEPAGEDADAIQRREQALGTDLLWLLHQGHVLDFAMGNLQAALRPLPKPTSSVSSTPLPPQQTSKADTCHEPETNPEIEASESAAATQASVEILEEPSTEAPVPETPEAAPRVSE